MRTQFCDALVAYARKPDVVFLTGDLGFMALEPLREAMQERFINAGVAEQNMMSVAAGLAKQQLDVWVYSIAPFCYARGFEQIRNDIAFHKLPVKIVGNGGGYGYGVMGPTHHAIEDYGILLTLPNMKAFVPVFDQDIDAVVARAASHSGPGYLRLGRGEPPAGWNIPAYAPWRQLTRGQGPVVIAVGPLAGSFIGPCEARDDTRRPNLWAVSELPLASNPPPGDLLRQIEAAGHLVIAEEHVRQGGLGSDLALFLMENGLGGIRIRHLCATAHHFSRYGSQTYMRREAGLDPDSLMRIVDDLQRTPAAE
ncbi:transketolase [Bradyrhizobium sp. U87765 SZCCT0131]|uniref:transketolase family protein n=1 Tax=unclassified Bradyrhizobium TaxID=2631580 RepID=UPI001BA842EC|nr:MULTISPECIES: transketolase [unclassified Bradyrhizobium]MBR1216914.1 transketolase [Bradyrhizobium sp. U87765 SZCCT0131]MBR1259330.1 transketolase [Bradyrhizobium sp. U87765 SZCCT0134]MBR1305471.1 transketolase [Bradyrhizobium sp. U87765 SZCCT0110]MBR1321838.1 transketolase [Bradyrhizobium sp. U87765 SZCCT0109]MBR1350884.1 transketolase [Bradyrhizobium sp. U87765 SZCCT0048]